MPLTNNAFVTQVMQQPKLGRGLNLNFGRNINPELHFVDDQANNGIVHENLILANYRIK